MRVSKYVDGATRLCHQRLAMPSGRQGHHFFFFAFFASELILFWFRCFWFCFFLLVTSCHHSSFHMTDFPTVDGSCAHLHQNTVLYFKFDNRPVNRWTCIQCSRSKMEFATIEVTLRIGLFLLGTRNHHSFSTFIACYYRVVLLYKP